MSKIQDYLRHGADLLDMVTTVLGSISQLTKNVKDDQAVAILQAVSAAADAALAGFAGTVTPLAVKDQLQRLTDRLTQNDSEADAAAKAKFGK